MRRGSRGTIAAAIFAGVLGLTVSGCQTTGTAAGNTANAAIPQFAGTEWRLLEIISMDDAIGTVRPADPSQYVMRLAADGSASLKLDCNQANGPWRADPASHATSGSFTIGPFAMTRAMCAPGSLDQRIARELGFVRSFVIKDGRLNLSLMADGGVYVWERNSDALAK